jgi:hypothetical protein
LESSPADRRTGRKYIVKSQIKVKAVNNGPWTRIHTGERIDDGRRHWDWVFWSIGNDIRRRSTIPFTYKIDTKLMEKRDKIKNKIN